MCLWFLSEGDIVDPCIKGMVNWLRLPDLLKCFLAWILKYTVSRGPRWGGIQEGRSPGRRRTQRGGWGPESSGGLEKRNQKG